MDPKLSHAAVAKAVKCDVPTMKYWLKRWRQSKDLRPATSIFVNEHPNRVKLGEYVDATMENLSPKSSCLREMWTKQGLKMGHFQSKSSLFWYV